VQTAWRLIRLRCTADPRGALVVAEGSKDVPFEIRRVFYMYGMGAASVRGQHANRVSKMMFLCVAGSFRIRVNDGERDAEYELANPAEGLFADRMTWTELYDFSPECVLLVLCDSPYDGGEYIRDRQEFEKEALEHRQ
jgi:hypothetical protein